jgi:hypothetical protein
MVFVMMCYPQLEEAFFESARSLERRAGEQVEALRRRHAARAKREQARGAHTA